MVPIEYDRCFSAISFGSSDIFAQSEAKLAMDRGAVFDEVTKLVGEHFYDRSFNQKEWEFRSQAFRSRTLAGEDIDRFSFHINQLLATLNTSHTFFYSRNDPKRFQLLGVFNQLFDQEQTDLFVYDGIGIDTRVVNESNHVLAMFDGCFAKTAGIRFGDEIRLADGKPFHPIESFKNHAGKTVELTIICHQTL